MQEQVDFINIFSLKFGLDFEFSLKGVLVICLIKKILLTPNNSCLHNEK